MDLREENSMREVVISTHDGCHAAIFHFVEQANEAQKELSFRRRRLSDEQKKLLYQGRLQCHEVCQQAFSLKKEYRLRLDDILILVLHGNLEDEEDDEYFFINGSDHCLEGQDCSGVGIISLYFLDPNSTFMKDGREWWSSQREFEQKKVASNSVLLLLLGAIATEVAGLECHPEMRGCIMDYCQSPTEITEATDGVFRFCKESCLPNLAKRPDGQAIAAIAKRLTEHRFSPHILPPEPRELQPVVDVDLTVPTLVSVPSRSSAREEERRANEATMSAGQNDDPLKGATPPHRPAVSLFCSYAHEDGKLRQQFERSISHLMRERLIEVWHDGEIVPGKEWLAEIDRELAAADVIILLVSPDFMQSAFINQVELKRAIERHEAGKVRVIPIILRPVSTLGALAKLEALPRKAKPVTTWKNRDSAWVDVAQGLERVLKDMLGS